MSPTGRWGYRAQTPTSPAKALGHKREGGNSPGKRGKERTAGGGLSAGSYKLEDPRSLGASAPGSARPAGRLLRS